MNLLPVRFLPLHTKIFSSLLLCVFFPRFKMKTSCACEACKKPFIPDPRHRHHQRFCSRAACQRARRQENQWLRRNRTQSTLRLPEAMILTAQGLPASEAAMKPHEAVLEQFHPIIIGLISHLIDSTAQEDIAAFLRRCALRGHDILYPPKPAPVMERPIFRPAAPARAAATRKAA